MGPKNYFNKYQCAKIINRQLLTLEKQLKESTLTPDERVEIEKKYAGMITNPFEIEKKKDIPFTPAFNNQLIIVIDAFESVCNGMYNQRALELLETLDNTSYFYNWKYLVTAINAFYNYDTETMISSLSKISQNSPVHYAARILKHLSGYSSPQGPLSYREKKLDDAVIEHFAFLDSSIGQVRECLEAGMEDLFIEIFALLLRDIAKYDTTSALRASLWGLKVILDNDYGIDVYITKLKAIFGNSEGLRMIALATLEQEPEISILFWIKLLTLQISTNAVSLEETAVYLRIIGDISQLLVQEYESDESVFTSIHNLTLKLHDELKNRYPGELGGFVISNNPFTNLAALADIFDGEKETIELESHVRQWPEKQDHKEHKSEATPVQLDLFAS